MESFASFPTLILPEDKEELWLKKTHNNSDSEDSSPHSGTSRTLFQTQRRAKDNKSCCRNQSSGLTLPLFNASIQLKLRRKPANADLAATFSQRLQTQMLAFIAKRAESRPKTLIIADSYSTARPQRRGRSLNAVRHEKPAKTAVATKRTQSPIPIGRNIYVRAHANAERRARFIQRAVPEEIDLW